MTNSKRRVFNATPNRRAKLLSTAMATVILVSLAGCGMTSRSAPATSTAPHQGSLMELANAMAARGEHNAAIPLYRGAHGQDSGAAAPLIGLGRSLVAVGQYVEAESAFQSAISADSNSADAQAGLGMTLLALGQTAAADAALRNALSLSPGHDEALRGKALANDLLGRHDAAEDIYRRALANGSNDVRLRNNYGLSLALHGASEDGIAVLEEIVRDRGGGVPVRQNLALAYALAGDREKAESLLRVDLDGERVARQMAFFAALGGMSPDGRLYALMNGGKLPARDLKEPGIERFADERHEQDAAVKVVGLPPAQPDVFAEVEPEPVVEPEPEPAPHADADLTDIPLLDTREGWALQLAAYRKASQLIAGWKLLLKENEDVIGHLPPRRTEIDFGDRETRPHGFFYRLNAGPLTSRAEAVELCAKLSERGTECWVRPPARDEGALPTKTAQAVQ